jgi:hypothetical protein
MKKYTIKVTCEYYVDVEAENEEQACDLAIEEEYDLGDLQNFNYYVDSVDEIEELEDEEND